MCRGGGCPFPDSSIRCGEPFLCPPDRSSAPRHLGFAVRLAIPPRLTAGIVVWSAATLTLNKGTGEVKASFEGKSTAGLRGNDAKNLQAALGEELAIKLRSKLELKNVAVTVEKQGNSLLLKGLADVP